MTPAARPAPRESLQDERLTAVGLLFEVAQAIENGMAPQLAEFGLSNV